MDQICHWLRELNSMTSKIAIIGHGNVGSTIKELLQNKYELSVGDIDNGIDGHNINQVEKFLINHDAVISAAPFSVNKNIASVAAKKNIGYFDLTEDVSTTEFVKSLKTDAVLIPQCGLAPGAINICASHLIDEFEEVDEVLMRVGALPKYTTNEMSYYLSWSTNGLINEYCNDADVIYEGKKRKVLPLEGMEKLMISGKSYEAFNTSGGCATMCDSYEGKVKFLSYKTIRYPGHLAHMKFLLNDLNLKKNKQTLEKLFDKEVPRTTNDVVIFFVKVIGKINGVLQEKTYCKKIEGQNGLNAIQLTTACGVCAVLELYLEKDLDIKGFCSQESISWDRFTSNSFGKIFL